MGARRLQVSTSQGWVLRVAVGWHASPPRQGIASARPGLIPAPRPRTSSPPAFPTRSASQEGSWKPAITGVQLADLPVPLPACLSALDDLSAQKRIIFELPFAKKCKPYQMEIRIYPLDQQPGPKPRWKGGHTRRRHCHECLPCFSLSFTSWV